MKKSIPSFITCLAVLSGCLSIASSVKYNLSLAGYLILIASLFDFLDGMFARLLGAITAFGKQLDSLADVVNFGVAPAMIMFRLMDDSLQNQPSIEGFASYIFLYVPFIIVIFAALRLAKFNIDETQTKIFKGLPTPANALFIASMGIYSESQGTLPLQYLPGNPWFLLSVVMVLSVLMVTDFSMFSLKFENMNLKNNWARYLLLLSSLIILFVMGTPGITVIIMLYIVLSVAKNLISKKI